MNNVFFCCLDSVRYDTFTAAATPNINKIGPTRKIHSFASWTLPSIMGYLTNMPPFGAPTLFPEAKQAQWVPRIYEEKGYETAWLSVNSLPLSLDRDLNGAFRRYFKHFKSLKYYDRYTATPLIVEDIEEIASKAEAPLFVFALLMDTHFPYFLKGQTYALDPDRPQENFRHQKKAIEYIDGFIPRLTKAFKSTGRPTEFTVTSDHGELFGSVYWGHSPREHCRFDLKLFEIPFVRGECNNGCE